ncbi:MAG: 23S rRNA (uracil(1939)-C(5))-methyltransferase RlmD [candidate division WOR-3 bacterium]
MVKKTYEVEIKKLTEKGIGIGFKGDKKILVPFSLPGERLIAEVVEEKKDIAFGRIKKFLRVHEKRKEPPCPYFGECGSCHIQMASYKLQLELKEEILRDILKEIGSFENLPIEKIEPSSSELFYRVKAQLPLKRIKGKIYMGFYKPNSHYIVDIDECIIHKKKISDLIKKIKEILQEERISVYDENKKMGRLKYCVIRSDLEEKNLLIIFVTYLKGFSKLLAKKIYEIDKENIKGIVENYNPAEGNKIFGEETKSLIGDDHLFQKIDKNIFRVSATSFFQLNPETAKKMLDFIISKMDRYDIGIDAFSGVGFFSIPLSEKFKKLISIEIDKSSYKDLLRNIKINDSLNVEAINADAGKYLKEIDKANLIIFDPPRKGLDEEIFKNIKRILPEKIIYVSCNPKSFVRDLKIFYEEIGYDIEILKPFDFFPQTYHIEICAFLKKR